MGETECRMASGNSDDLCRVLAETILKCISSCFLIIATVFPPVKRKFQKIRTKNRGLILQSKRDPLPIRCRV